MKELFILILLWLGGLLMGVSVGIQLTQHYTPKVDLPEEYKLMIKHDTIQGYYNKDNSTLYIYYNNPRNK